MTHIKYINIFLDCKLIYVSILYYIYIMYQQFKKLIRICVYCTNNDLRTIIKFDKLLHEYSNLSEVYTSTICKLLCRVC